MVNKLSKWSNSQLFQTWVNRVKKDGIDERKWTATWQNQQCVCAPSEDSDQPGHSPSLIRGFAVHMKKAWVLNYSLSAQRRLRSAWASSDESDQTGQVPRLICVFAGCITLLVLSFRSSSIEETVKNHHLFASTRDVGHPNTEGFPASKLHPYHSFNKNFPTILDSSLIEVCKQDYCRIKYSVNKKLRF